MMIALLIAGLIAGIGYFFYRRSAGGAGGAAPTSATPVGVPNETVTSGGIDFVTKAGTDYTRAIAGGASAYDIADPDTAKRTVDAIARAGKLTNIAMGEGLTVDGLYQKHLATEMTANTNTWDRSLTFAKSSSGFVPTGAPTDLQNVLAAQNPLMGNQPPPPGQYWNYATMKYEPLIF